MEEEVQFILESTEEAMGETIAYYEKQLGTIRAGKASPFMLNSVRVDYYGSQTPLSQIGNISTPDAQTISIRPFEKSMISEIERSIMAANLGFNPMNNGESIIISVPPLTEERRRELAKQAKGEAEEAKIGVRNERKNANNSIKKLDISEDFQRSTEEEIQKLTDKFIAQIDKIYEVKEKEIMTI